MRGRIYDSDGGVESPLATEQREGVSINEESLHILRCRGYSLLKNGGYLLSHNSSTIGAGGLNFSVRNGKRWNPATVTTLILVTQCDKQS